MGVIGLRPDDDFKDRARKVEIHFTRSQAAYQLTSEKAIKQAVQRGDITLKVTDQIFRWEFDDEEREIQAYFYDQLVEVELKPIKPKARHSNEDDDDDDDPELNSIYMSDASVNGQPFISVIGLLPEDELQKRCRRVEIRFAVAPYQLTSEEAILNAANNGDITLNVTSQIFRWDEDDLEDIFEDLIFITLQPQSQVVPLGSDVTFKARARSEHKFHQQWQFNGVDIPGATDTSYTVRHARLADAGAYTIIFFNRSISVTSAPAYLTIGPVILTPPADQTFACGSNVFFSVSAIGTPPLTYQWLFNGQPIPDATNATLLVENLDPSKAGSYAVQVSSPGGGTITSREAALVEETPGISKLVIAPDGVMLLCWPMTCTKFKMEESTNGVDWTAVMAPVGMLSDSNCMTVPISDHAFRLVHSNLKGPRILSQPLSFSAPVGSSVMLSITASGSLPLFYQWRLNGESLPGETNPDLLLQNMTLTNFGTYEVTVVNACAAEKSGLIVLSPSDFPGGLTDYFNDRGNSGEMAGVVVTNSDFFSNETGEPFHDGKPPAASAWFSWSAPLNGIAHFDTVGSSFDTVLAVYTGADLATLNPKAADDDKGGFKRSAVLFNADQGQSYAIAVDGVGGASGTIVLRWYYESTNGDALPEITVQPSDAVATNGGFAGFGVEVNFDSEGGPFPTYQWKLNGTNLPGQTKSGISIGNIQDTDLGIYTVVVTIGSRSVESRPATLQTTTGPLDVVFVSKPLFNFAPRVSPPIPIAPLQAAQEDNLVLAAASDDTSQGTTISTSGSTGTSPIGQPPPCQTNSFVTFYITNFVTKANTKMVMLHTRGSTTPRNGTNAALDTIISAITGSLTNVVACNNDDAAGFAPSSYVYFPATATTRYLIRIDTPSTTVRAGTILRLTSRMDTNVVATASP